MAPKEEFEFDLESGRTSNEDQNASQEQTVSSDTRQEQKKSLTKALFGVLSFVGSIKCRNGFDLFSSLAKSGKVLNENLESVIERNPKREEIGSRECVCLVEKCRIEKYKNTKTSSKKAPKPPRPPKGPSLDAFDHKVVREIVQLQLARRKRASMERMRIERMKAAKASSSSGGGIFTMIITTVILVIFIFRCKNVNLCSSIVFGPFFPFLFNTIVVS
ncbi:Transmembrane protein [Trema orientale]|uniref:Transmembrane protein n=1 Tax=Trema orientale TaxID=63057 RepID=A0A2P5B870_TREOI|nr:Transmembrane protein [Trema orientale]